MDSYVLSSYEDILRYPHNHLWRDKDGGVFVDMMNRIMILYYDLFPSDEQ